jgi:predicted nucleic acid-binding protein
MDANDRDHKASAELLSNSPEELLVPAPVLVELDWLGTTRGLPAVQAVLDSINSAEVAVADLHPDDYDRIAELCRDYEDLRLGFVDAAVIAVAEREGERVVATLDHRHFSVVRPRHVRAFTLVPELA